MEILYADWMENAILLADRTGRAIVLEEGGRETAKITDNTMQALKERDGVYQPPIYLDIPDRVFEGLFYGTRRYQKIVRKDHLRRFDDDVKGLTEFLDGLEDQVIMLMHKISTAELACADRVDMGGFYYSDPYSIN